MRFKYSSNSFNPSFFFIFSCNECESDCSVKSKVEKCELSAEKVVFTSGEHGNPKSHDNEHGLPLEIKDQLKK